MSDPVKNLGVEDVLSSIRRLVSEGGLRKSNSDRTAEPHESAGGRTATPSAPDAANANRLVLTPALRVAETGDNSDHAGRAQNATPHKRSFFDAKPVQTDHSATVTPPAKAEQAEPQTAETNAGSGQNDSKISVFGGPRSKPEALAEPAANGKSTAGETDDPDVEPLFHVSRRRLKFDTAGFGYYENEHVAEAKPEKDAAAKAVRDSADQLLARARERRADAEVLKADASGPSEPFELQEIKSATAGAANKVKAAEAVSAGEPIKQEAPVKPEPPVRLQPEAREDEPVVAEAEIVADDEEVLIGEKQSVFLDAASIDENALRDLISEVVREELQGALGERITRNVRKLVRREIHRAMISQDFE